MTPEAAKALEESIAHWKRMREDPMLEEGPARWERNRLCQLFLVRSYCVGCPVRERTRKSVCIGTPWKKAEDAFASCERYGFKGHAMARWQEAATKEIEFLESLRELREPEINPDP